MRKIIDRKTAYRAVLILFAILAILSVWPCRLWTNVLETSAGGERIEEDQPVNIEHFYSQRFIARYDRLSSVDLYISNVEKGRYIDITVCDLGGKELVKNLIDTEGKTIPGYVNVPLEYNVKVGEEYLLYIRGCRSKFYVNFETITDNPEAGYVERLNDHYFSPDGNFVFDDLADKHIAARYNYRLPVSKKISLAIICVIAAITALLYALIGGYYSKHSDRNTIMTVEKCVKYTANPIAAVFYLTLMVMVFPLKVFDARALDIIFYEIGLIVAAGITFYAINHKAVKSEVGISFIDGIEAGDRVRYFIMMLSIAMAIWHGCDYMNGIADIFHRLSERRMVIWLAVLILLTFTAKEAFNAPNLLWLIVSGIGGFYYYHKNLIPETENEFDLKNAVIKYEVIIAILGGFLAINLIQLLINYIQEKVNKNISVNESRARVSVYGILVYILFVLLIVTRNSGMWVIALAVTFTCLYVRGLVWKGRKDWLNIISGGLMLNFVISLCYSLLHRCFAGYVSGRFGFIFHTQTVAAEYLVFMEAVATVLLTAKIVALPKKTGMKDFIKTSWKEMLLFGWIAAYAIFTVSEMAYISIFICVFFVLVVMFVCYRKKIGSILVTMIISVIVCFPPAFTLQRMIPAMVGDPVILAYDDTDPFVRGGAEWGSTNYMCVERFANLFASEILGMDMKTYDYPHDIYNYDPETGEPCFDEYGDPIEESEEENESLGMTTPAENNLLVAAQFTNAEAAMLLDALNGYVDESNVWDIRLNGRITIFKTYLNELNMTGHDDVQPVLPDGNNAMHAHNTYLQVAYNHGIPVGIFFTIVIVAGLICGLGFFRKNKETNPLALIPFAVIIGFMMAGMSEWVFQFSNPTTLALMLSIFPLMQNNE
ncbi:MAG: hypothetical protein J5504_08075 [Butyrivibrio sp.]|nr:hypothetical protein [Butyrivibrio sp.]